METLQQLTFLLTRPTHQVGQLSTQITAAGGRCLLFPTITIEPLPRQPTALITLQQSYTHIDKIIFVSSNAVLPVMAYWPKDNHSLQSFAIGPGTATALASFGITAKIPAEKAFTSQGLLDLPELQAVQNQRIIIFKGVGGNDLLAKQLRQRAAQVDEVAVYQRLRPPLTIRPYWPIWQQYPLDCIISCSSESLANLHAMAENDLTSLHWLQMQQLLVISDGMKELAQKLGFKQPPLLAVNASDAAILETLAHFALSKNYLPTTKQ